MIAYLKIGGILAVLAGAFWAGWSISADRATAAANALHAAQLQAAVTALDAQASQRAAAEAKLAKVQGDYDAIKDLPDAAAPIVASRLLLVAASAGSCPVPSPAADAGRAPAAAPVAVGPSSVATALGDYISACDADAHQLAALEALAPK